MEGKFVAGGRQEGPGTSTVSSGYPQALNRCLDASCPASPPQRSISSAITVQSQLVAVNARSPPPHKSPRFYVVRTLWGISNTPLMTGIMKQ